MEEIPLSPAGTNDQGDAQKGQLLGQRHRPSIRQPINIKVSKQFSFEIRKIRPSEVFLIFRMLLTKVGHEGVDSLCEQERVLLHLLFLEGEKAAKRDISFFKIWNGKVGETLQNLFLWISGSLVKTPSGLDGYIRLLQRIGSLATPRAYYGWAKSFSIGRCFRTNNRSLDRKAPPIVRSWSG